MKANVYPVQLNVADAARSLPFYRDLLGYPEYRILGDAAGLRGMSNGKPARGLARGRGGGLRVSRRSVGFDRVAARARLRQAWAGADESLSRNGGGPVAPHPARSIEAP
jgi:catechol 2,3-dioxygenase-like lactoylglutathione lyase family enzyme